VALTFDLPIRLLPQADRMPKVGGKVAVARGPLLFCVESTDHPALAEDDLFDLAVDPTTFHVYDAPDVLDGAVAIEATTLSGHPVRFVPYFLWGNRGGGAMTAFVRTTA
jgi:DUF1680 family protein